MFDEFVEIQKEFPNVSFDNNPYKRNKNTSIVLLETKTIRPDNYDIKSLLKYKKVYTWNSKVRTYLTDYGIDIELINGVPLFNNYNWLSEFTPFENKRGVCLMCRHRKNQSFDFDIAWLRETIFLELDIDTKHCYGKIPYGGNCYRGVVGDNSNETKPSSLAKLETLDKYKFNLCFENTYDPVWSWDYLTEKLTDAMRAKTLAIYWGCYNIEEIVPKGLYIDYRDFDNSIELSEYLKDLSDEEYVDRVEKAYDWVCNTRWGNVADLKNQLRSNGEG